MVDAGSTERIVMLFFLGAHQPEWLEKTAVPLFISRRRLAKRRRLPRAMGTWALDSGAFTEISTNGRWTLGAAAYAGEVRRYRDEIGGLAWAAIQDWMCEPHILEKTGLSLIEHQRRTIDNYLELNALAPDLPWVPVLQGWTLMDYVQHMEDYRGAGVNLAGLPLVGLGSVCRRQAMIQASLIVGWLSGEGIRLHGFGVKLQGLSCFGGQLASADSMAWSFHARREKKQPGCTKASCANCLHFALEWRSGVVERFA
jgi:hypothetical protein